MGIKSKLVTLVAGLVGLSSFSQAPEFTQQYKQRLGGAVQELRVVVDDFDTNAKDALLTREDALGKLQNSKEQFVQDRGNSMGKTIMRFTVLDLQQQNMSSSNSLLQPLYLAQNPDLELVQGAWSMFKPAVPLNKDGAVYAGIGGLLAMLLARLGIGWQRKRKLKEQGLVLGTRAITKSDKVLVAQVESSNFDDFELSELELLETETNSADFADAQPLLEAVKGDHANAMQFKQQIYGEVDLDGKIVQMRTPPKS